MSSIGIRWERRAVKELRGLPRETRTRVIEAVEGLRLDPLAGTQLSGRFKGLRRLRVGAVRVIYGFDSQELSIAVLRVAHRRDAYRS